MRKAGIMFAFLGVLLIVGFAVSASGDYPSRGGSVGVHQPGATQPAVMVVPGTPSTPALAPGSTPRPVGTGGISAGGGGVGNGPMTGGGAGVGGAQTGSGYVSSLPNIADRKVVRSVNLDVVVENVVEAVQLIESRAQAAGGYVSASTLTIETARQPATPSGAATPQRERATITVRVPSETYPGVVNAVRGLGDVKSESSDTSEVTQEYTDLEARLRNLNATEAQFLELLSRAEAIPDIITVQDRLNNTRLESEFVVGRMQLLDDLTDLATISATLSLPPPPSVEERPVLVEEPPPPDDPGWAEEAWDNAWGESQDILETMGVAAITAAVILLWIFVPMVTLLVGWRVFSIFSRGRPAA